MPVYAHPGGKWLIAVIDRKNAPGAGRIKKVYTGTREGAEDLEKEIAGSLKLYGMWPVPEGTRPIDRSSTLRVKPDNNLTETFALARSTLWREHRSERTSTTNATQWEEWFLDEGVADMDGITSEHIERFIEEMRKLKLTPSTINQKLSTLRAIIRYAYRRKPKLMTTLLEVPTVSNPPLPKWWLRPEWVPPLVDLAIREGMDILADYVPFICFTGLRVEEALRLRAKHFDKLDTDKPTMRVPGRKTKNSEATVPLFREAALIVRKRIRLVGEDNLLFPIQYNNLGLQWTRLRKLSGWGDEKTATLKALRRTFAKIANDGGLGGFDIMKLLRHSSITTTQGYLNLVGDASDLERIRSRFERKAS